MGSEFFYPTGEEEEEKRRRGKKDSLQGVSRGAAHALDLLPSVNIRRKREEVGAVCFVSFLSRALRFRFCKRCRSLSVCPQRPVARVASALMERGGTDRNSSQ